MPVNKNKPIWNKSQIAKIKRYLKSKEWANDLKKIQQKWEKDEDRENSEKLEFIDWWVKNKDIPYI